jgi:hypothetical protein
MNHNTFTMTMILHVYGRNLPKQKYPTTLKELQNISQNTEIFQ